MAQLHFFFFFCENYLYKKIMCILARPKRFFEFIFYAAPGEIENHTINYCEIFL